MCTVASILTTYQLNQGHPDCLHGVYLYICNTLITSLYLHIFGTAVYIMYVPVKTQFWQNTVIVWRVEQSSFGGYAGKKMC